MARPVSISDETIIEAARAVFLEHGIQATTAEVAARAGVSEGSIFKRFKSKFELFRAAMGDQLTPPEWLRRLPERVGQGDIQDHLFELGMEIVDFFRQIMPLVLMSWSHRGRGEFEPPFANEPNPPPVRAIRQVSAYLEAEMRAGRLRRHDPEVAARAFLGSLNNFVMLEVLHGAGAELPLAQATFVRGLINLLWVGLEPAPQAR